MKLDAAKSEITMHQPASTINITVTTAASAAVIIMTKNISNFNIIDWASLAKSF